jgi:hypothetical protein
MREYFRPIATNLTPVNVVGIPGLILVIVAIALAIQFPEVQWLVLAGISGGMLIAAVLIARRGRKSGRGDGDHSQGVLHIDDHPPTSRRAPSRPSRLDTRQVVVPAGA